MSVQNIAIVDYDGPQGSKELEHVESADLNRSKSRSRIGTMNRARANIAMQSGMEEVGVSLTVVPEIGDPEIDWHRAWKNDEVFTLTIEKGIDGRREQVTGCMVESVNDSWNKDGEARMAVEVVGLGDVEEP